MARPVHLLGEDGRTGCCGKNTAFLGMGATFTDDPGGVSCPDFQPPEEYVPSEPQPGWEQTDLSPFIDAVNENIRTLAAAHGIPGELIHTHGPEDDCTEVCSAQQQLKQRPGDQPLPVVNDEPDVQSQVIADIEERRQVGIQRYGTALQPFNGRDAARDLYEELLDGAMYAKQLLLERQVLLAKIAELEEERDALLAGQIAF